MIRSDRRVKILAVSLSMLAGFVDAIGFITLGGYFVSFMSGNSTRLAVGIARGVPAPLTAAMLIAIFVLGVMAGSVTGHIARHDRPAFVLVLVSAALAVAAGLGLAGIPFCAALAMAFAMGAENTIFERDGEVQIGLTYMTGTLVKLGQRLTGALLGGERFAWVGYFFLWIGLVSGAVMGALAYPVLGLQTLWIASAVAAVLAALMRRLVAPAAS
jgi:uncharacterized membrane protein YoaK (UPF0700 family)